MRALKAVTILMGVLILAGTAVLIATIVKRVSAPPGPTATAPLEVVLDEPSGTRIGAVAASGDRLAVTLQGGGPDRIVLLDAGSGARVGRIRLAR